MKSIQYSLVALCITFISCSKTIDNTGTCSDGRMNQGEQGIDCGGPCNTICPSCADGILNQDETGVDCGGQCDPCYPGFSAKINNTIWNSTSRNAMLWSPGTIRIYGTNVQKNITLFYSGPFVTGTVSTGSNFNGEIRDETGNLYTSASGGVVTFTTFDTLTRKVSGTFSFTATDTVNNVSIQVTSGVFTELEY
jgi:hypothetical protein